MNTNHQSVSQLLHLLPIKSPHPGTTLSPCKGLKPLKIRCLLVQDSKSSKLEMVYHLEWPLLWEAAQRTTRLLNLEFPNTVLQQQVALSPNSTITTNSSSSNSRLLPSKNLPQLYLTLTQESHRLKPGPKLRQS